MPSLSRTAGENERGHRSVLDAERVRVEEAAMTHAAAEYKSRRERAGGACERAGESGGRGRRMGRLTADEIALTRSPAGVRSWFSRNTLWANWNRAPNAGSPHSTDKNQCR